MIIRTVCGHHVDVDPQTTPGLARLLASSPSELRAMTFACPADGSVQALTRTGDERLVAAESPEDYFKRCGEA